MIERWVYLGNAVQLHRRLATGDLVQALMQNTGEEIPFRQGDAVTVYMPPEALRVLTGHGPCGDRRRRRRCSLTL